MSTSSASPTADNSCWDEWILAIRARQPGLYWVAGGVGSGKQTVLERTRALLSADGVPTIDGAGIVEVDDMLKGIVVIHGEIRSVSDMQHCVDLAAVGAVVLCTIHGFEVKDVLQRINHSAFGDSFDVVVPLIRAVMTQVLLRSASQGTACVNELAVFQSPSDVQRVLEHGPARTLRNDAEAKLAAGIFTAESARRAGVLA